MVTSDPDYSTIQDFKINRFPFICFYYNENNAMKVIPLNPDILYLSLKAMVDNIIYHKTKTIKRKPFHSEVVKQIYENTQLKQICSSTDTCVIGFFNAQDENTNAALFNEMIEKFEYLAGKEKFKELTWGWVNSTCQIELSQKFTMPENGGVIIYQQWKGVYSRFIFPTDDLQLFNFFDKTIENRFVYNEINPEEFVLNDKDCSETSKKSYIEEEEKEKKNKEDEIKEKKNFDPKMKTDL